VIQAPLNRTMDTAGWDLPHIDGAPIISNIRDIQHAVIANDGE
jgi:hypothetical protein